MDESYKVVFPAQNRVELQECEIPQCKENEMLVKSIVTNISTGTELTLLQANVDKDSPWWSNIRYPNEPGYSNVGRVIAVGANVPQQMIGKRILSSAKHRNYAVVDYTNPLAYKTIPDGVATEEAALGTIAKITLGSIRVAQIRPGDCCVVYGAGIIGQMVARFAKVAGSSTVIVTDVSNLRLSKLPKDPCFVTVNTKEENAEQVVKEKTAGRGADVVFETTGVPSLVEQELHCLAMRGKLIITSSPKGASTVSFDYCNRMGITIIGAHNNAVHTPVETPADRWTKANDVAYFFELLLKKQISVREMITHEICWKEAVQAYQMLMEDRTQALAVNLIWEEA